MLSQIIFISLVLFLSLTYTFSAFGLSFGNLEMPGPGFLPVILGIIACVISLSQLIKVSRKELTKSEREEKEPYLWRAVLFVCIFVLYVLLLPLIGYLLDTTLFVIAIFKIMGLNKWLTAIGGGIIIGALCYLLFNVWLGVPLPNGLWAP